MELHIKFDGKRQEKKGQGRPIRLKLINNPVPAPTKRNTCAYYPVSLIILAPHKKYEPRVWDIWIRTLIICNVTLGR